MDTNAFGIPEKKVKVRQVRARKPQLSKGSDSPIQSELQNQQQQFIQQQLQSGQIG